MKTLDRYIIANILKIAFFAIMIFALILAAVELFSKMDQIMNSDIPFNKILQYILLSIPEYLLMVSSFALLFATTYFLSTLSANNEKIALLNAGISKFRIALPIVCLSIVLTFVGFVYQENVLNKIMAKHDEMNIELFGMSSTQDSRNIVLKDEDGFIIYTNRYNETNMRIYNPILVKVEDEHLKLRVEAHHADNIDGSWVFYDAVVYTLEDGVSVSYEDEYIADGFNIEANLFKGQNLNIETMDSDAARAYLKRLQVVDKDAWQDKATDYYRALFQPLAILVLMIVSALMNYNFKKNVLLFSIIESLSIAVVYYCSDMVFSIAAHQSVITPYMAVALPLIVTVAISYIMSLLGKKI